MSWITNLSSTTPPKSPHPLDVAHSTAHSTLSTASYRSVPNRSIGQYALSTADPTYCPTHPQNCVSGA
eukprot:3345008-Rhodomonas_salina.1